MSEEGVVPPRYRRWLLVGGSVVAFIAVLYAVVGDNESTLLGPSTETTQIRSVITDGDNSQVSLQSVAAKLDELTGKLGEIKGRLDQRDQTYEAALAGVMDALRREIQSNTQRTDEERRADIKRLEDVIAQATGRPIPEADDALPLPEPMPVAVPPPATSTEPVAPATAPETPEPAKPRSLRAADLFAPEAIPEAPPAPPPGMPPGAPGEAGSHIRQVTGRPASAAETAPPAPALPGKVITLPAGSIISGVLLSGLDAPTGSQAQKDPVPLLVRVKHNAILPNRYTVDVRECFILLAAFGELSSERAQLRGEKLSCILKSGAVVESDLAAYGVGEDGKQGIRGRIVSKQGSYIAGALMSGFLDGAARAFANEGQNDAVSVNPQSGQLTAGTTQTPTGAFMEGTSSALDRISKYYLDQASQLFPVIEIDVGRPVDIVLTRSMTIRLDI
jgi:conjugal transfer pilus assembly protein TraB